MQSIQLKDFLDFQYVSALSLNNAGTTLAYVVKKSDVEKNAYQSGIYIMDTKTKKSIKLTNQKAEFAYVWLNDTTILFPSARDEGLKAKAEQGEMWTAFYQIATTGGEAEEYMRVPMQVTGFKVIDENTFAVTATFDHNARPLHTMEGKEREEAVAQGKLEKEYQVIDEIPFWFNGQGFTNKTRNRLYIFNRKTGEMLPVSGEYSDVGDFKVKEGKIAYTTTTFTDKYDQLDALNCYDIESKENTVLLPQAEYAIGYVDFFGKDILFTATDMKHYGINENHDIFLMREGKMTLFQNHDAGFGSSVGSDCRLGGGKSAKVVGDACYFINTVGGASYLNKLSADGTIERITQNNGSVDCFDTDGTSFYFVGMRGNALQEIYQLDGEKEEKLTTHNEEVMAEKSVVTPKYIPFKARDGVELEAYVLEPVGYDSQKQYPAILDIHGGPKTVYGTVYFHEMQVWANMGYFVFFCNPRGSDGFGNAFADIRGKYGTVDYEDFMDLTDHVLALYPQIQKENVGVTGGSYGGYMTNWIIGHTDRYKCAVSQRSISNWISKFGTTDIGYYFNVDQNASSPWDNHDKLWWHSPLKYADKCVTPTLFIHSRQDYRCWLPEGLQMFTALKYHGVEARLCMFHNENHELSRGGKPMNRVKRLEEMTNWFEKHLKG